MAAQQGWSRGCGVVPRTSLGAQACGVPAGHGGLQTCPELCTTQGSSRFMTVRKRSWRQRLWAQLCHRAPGTRSLAVSPQS